MTKMIKMSLIAAVAVTGITSTVSAQPLEEAIKGVDVSGMLRYRYDDKKTDSTTNTDDKSEQWNNYRLDINTKAKVNDIVTANVTVNAGVGAQNDGKGADLNDNTEAAATLAVRNANFTFALPVATVIAGKQSIPGPFVDNTSDDVSRGTGAVALIPVGPVTIAAGHFVTHSVDVADSSYMTTAQKTAASAAGVDTWLKAKNATELAVIGSAAGVSFDVWYANVTDTLDATSFGLKTAVAGINLDARYSTLDITDAYRKTGLSTTANGESSLLKVVASTKLGAATVKAGLAMTGEHNGQGVQGVNRISIDADNDSQSDFRLWQASAGALADGTAFLIGAGMEVMPSVTVTADYLTASANESDAAGAKDLDVTELLVGATYAMSKNFSVHARYSMMSTDYASATADVDADRGRLELKYTF